MAACSYIKPSGDRCRAIPMRGESFCYVHHPDLAQERAANSLKGGKRGGRGRPAKPELPAIKALIGELTDKVLSGELETGRAAVANQLMNTRLRAIELERKIRETQELEERLERLEAGSQPRTKPGGIRWG
jgi:hypothetical protein